MMPYTYGTALAGLPQTSQLQQTTYHSDAFLEDLSHQLASVSSTIRRRHSRGSHYGSRTPGSVMRIVKPSSANNSPQSSSMMQARRRMLINNESSSNYTSPHRISQHLPLTPQEYAGVQRYDTAEGAAVRPARPVSWHPSSTYLLPNQLPLSLATHFQVPTYTTPATAAAGYEPLLSMQPYTLSPAAYSTQTSPSTAFSPYSGNFDSSTAGHYYSPNPWAMSPSVNTNGAMFDKLPSPVDCPALVPGHMHQEQQVPAPEYQVPQQQQSSYHSEPSTVSSSSTEWSAYNRTAAPPTPPDTNCFSASELAEARIPSDDSIACQTLEEDEPEGEILVGMGLYDTPEKELVDPTLQSYRTSMAQLLSGTFKYPEPTGKGLKLEDAWEPPENTDDDDQEEEEDDEERDAEGEEH